VAARRFPCGGRCFWPGREHAQAAGSSQAFSIEEALLRRRILAPGTVGAGGLGKGMDDVAVYSDELFDASRSNAWASSLTAPSSRTL